MADFKPRQNILNENEKKMVFYRTNIIFTSYLLVSSGVELY